MAELLQYCKSPYHLVRRPTRVVRVGAVAVGGDNPIRVQSMTIEHTHDVEGTVAEIVGLTEVGCEIVRMTVASGKDAAALPAIRSRLQAQGRDVPLVADIHYAPANAMAAVEVVDKVRVNPGNLADRKKFDTSEISDEQFEAARRQVDAVFRPLVERARERGVAIRVGVNHGSLSDRMVNRFGDSPAGMVESALEYLRICVDADFREVIISMKSSNPIIMIQAYRLLVARMDEEGMDFPLHLGVTEAGEGREGRVKSAVGIGALLEDGIGDTIRVSLTEEAAAEVPVAAALARRARLDLDDADAAADADLPRGIDPFVYSRRRSRPAVAGPLAYGAVDVPRVEMRVANRPAAIEAMAAWLESFAPGADRHPETLELDVPDLPALEALVAGGKRVFGTVTQGNIPAISLRIAREVWSDPRCSDVLAALTTAVADRVSVPWSAATTQADRVLALADAGFCLLIELPQWTPTDVDGWRLALVDGIAPYLEANVRNLLLGVAVADHAPASAPARLAVAVLDSMNFEAPLVLIDSGAGDPVLDSSARLGSILCDGIGDAIRIEADMGHEELLDLSYDILQATRSRTSKAEFISCPSCGRTLFDLATTSRRIRDLTGHLKGVKIGIMGCLVNGPGEMADADFGYVGWKVGRVNLYVGQECVVENVPEDAAAERLVDLIREHGRWVDPPVTVTV